MGNYLKNLSALPIWQHPAVEEFLADIQRDLHTLPRLEEVLVTNDMANDGFLDLSYIHQNKRIFAARLNGKANSILLRRGTLDDQGMPQWDGPANGQLLPGVCSTLHVLGGKQEAAVSCTDRKESDLTVDRAKFLGAVGVANWTSLELGGWLFKRKSFSSWAGKKLLSGFTPVGKTEASLMEGLNLRSPSLWLGTTAMVGSQFLASAMGLDPRFHTNERFALGAMATYSTMWTSDVVKYDRFFHAYHHPDSPEFKIQKQLNINPQAEDFAEAEAWAQRNRSLSPSFGARLLSSALVDATLGKNFAEGSTERQALRMGSFFIPDFYRIAMGGRRLAFTQTPRMLAFGRWAKRAAVAGFLANAGYMGYEHITKGNAETARENALYARANEFQARDQNMVASFFHGLAEAIAPALTQRYGVSEEYVELAREEFRRQSEETSKQAENLFRNYLMFTQSGKALDAESYQHIDWSAFRGGNPLENIRRVDGKFLPIADIAEQMHDPEIARRHFENTPIPDQVRYLQQQFRAYQLSEADVHEVMGRIALQKMCQDIAELHLLDTPEHQPLLRFFDENGKLREGQEQSLVAHLFPEMTQAKTQAVALNQ
jgi:hypothetical protein